MRYEAPTQHTVHAKSVQRHKESPSSQNLSIVAAHDINITKCLVYFWRVPSCLCELLRLVKIVSKNSFPHRKRLAGYVMVRNQKHVKGGWGGRSYIADRVLNSAPGLVVVSKELLLLFMISPAGRMQTGVHCLWPST